MLRYEGHWDASWPATEPRPVNWNCSAEARANHAGVVPTQPMLTAEAGRVVTAVFKNRWRTPMSVDDVATVADDLRGGRSRSLSPPFVCACDLCALLSSSFC